MKAASNIPAACSRFMYYNIILILHCRSIQKNNWYKLIITYLQHYCFYSLNHVCRCVVYLGMHLTMKKAITLVPPQLLCYFHQRYFYLNISLCILRVQERYCHIGQHFHFLSSLEWELHQYLRTVQGRIFPLP